MRPVAGLYPVCPHCPLTRPGNEVCAQIEILSPGIMRWTALPHHNHNNANYCTQYEVDCAMKVRRVK